SSGYWSVTFFLKKCRSVTLKPPRIAGDQGASQRERAPHGRRRRAAGHGPRADRGLHRDRVLDVTVDQRREAPQLGKREVFERLALVEGVAHEPADDLVRLAKGHALLHEVVREIGGGREVLSRRASHPIGAE